jgi:hypothetical protein
MDDNGIIVTTDRPFDDGHIPERWKHVADRNLQNYQPLLRTYSRYHTEDAAQIHVFDDEDENGSADFAKCVYDYTTRINPYPTWGSYVTMEQIQNVWKEGNIPEDPLFMEKGARLPTLCKGDSTRESLSKLQDQLAIQAAAMFMKKALQANTSTCRFAAEEKQTIQGKEQTHDQSLVNGEQVSSSSFWNNEDCIRAHGVAVWALSSAEHSEVPYHIDYAELLRYETGLVVPPVLAGTWHCSQEQIVGGELGIHPDGLKHYQKHGYKEMLSPIHYEQDPKWVWIPYRFNRVIAFSGHLPHLSTKTLSIQSQNSQDSSSKRVVVGFNVFLKDVGPTIMEAPEHSEAFRKRVTTRKATLTLTEIQNNPKLREFLVVAKREKVKLDFERAQKELDDKIQRFLESHSNVTVQLLLDHCKPSPTATQWPVTIVDVHVHIHRRWKEKRILSINDISPSSIYELIDPKCVVRLP